MLALLVTLALVFSAGHAGWLLVAEFIFTLAMALKCYPLLPGGLLAPISPRTVGDMGYLGQSLHDRLELKGIDLMTPVRKNMKQKKILFPNFSKRRKVIERVFSFLTNLGAERCKSRSPQGFQLKLEMILLAYSLLLKSAKSLEPETLRYSIGYQVMAK